MKRKETLDHIRKYATHDREPFYKIAANYHMPGDRVLDIGAGLGAFAETIGTDGIFLIEGNIETVGKLRERYRNTYHLQLPNKLPFGNNFFNLIHSSHLIEHLTPNELYEVLNEIDRCLAPMGHLVISTPLLWEGFYDDLSHIKPYNPVVLQNYFCDSIEGKIGQRTRSAIAFGYEVIDLIYRYRISPIPHFNLSHRNTWLQRLLFKLTTSLNLINGGSYERTGYTIVLRKPASSENI